MFTDTEEYQYYRCIQKMSTSPVSSNNSLSLESTALSKECGEFEGKMSLEMNERNACEDKEWRRWWQFLVRREQNEFSKCLSSVSRISVSDIRSGFLANLFELPSMHVYSWKFGKASRLKFHACWILWIQTLSILLSKTRIIDLYTRSTACAASEFVARFEPPPWRSHHYQKARLLQETCSEILARNRTVLKEFASLNATVLIKA